MTPAQHSSSLSQFKANLASGLALLSVLGLTDLARGADRLQPYTASLTTYTAGPTRMQGVTPLPSQRFVGYDGAVSGVMSRLGAGQVDIGIGETCGAGQGGGGMHVTPSPEMVGGGSGAGVMGRMMNGIDLKTGNYTDGRVHMHLPQPGADWVIAVDHNTVQASDSAGPQGADRFQRSAMEVKKYHDGITDDMLYLVTGAGGYQEFAYKASSGNLFEAKNGGHAVAMVESLAGRDLVHLYDLAGNEFVFFAEEVDPPTINDKVEGQLWKIIDPNGNTSYVGDASSASTAESAGFSSGKIIKAYDAVDRRYSYTYDGNGRLSEVKAETKASGTWASPSGLVTVGKVEYSYYGGGDSYGEDGDLKLVKVTIPLTDTGAEVVQKTYYRYYEGGFDGSTNPGYDHQIKYIYESEGLRQFDWTDSTFDEDFLTASSDDLKPYASAYFKYDSSHRVSQAWFNGSCGCSGGSGSGTYTFTYGTNAYHPATSGYDPQWHTRTIVKEPDKGDVASTNKWVTTYFDEVGQVLAQVITEEDPANEPARFWATVYDRDWSTSAMDGTIEFVHTPANVTGYDHSDDNHDNDLFTLSSSVGLVIEYDRFTSGNYQGLVNHVKYHEGTGGTGYLQSSQFYGIASQTITGSSGNGTVAHIVTVGRTIYSTQTSTSDTGPGNSPPSGAYRTEMTYDFYDDGGQTDPLAIEEITTTYPIVTTGNNGSNSATSVSQHYRLDGRVDFAKAADAIITYYEYGTAGHVTKVIQDADTTQDGGGGEQTDFSGISIPSGFSTTSPSSAFHMRRVMTYDRIGRVENVTSYKSKSATIEEESLSYVSKLADHRRISLSYPKFETSGTKYYGPVQMSVANHSGGTEVSAIIALDDNSGEYTTDAQSTHVDETDSDPILAVEAIGDLKRMSVQVYNKAGSRVDESRSYFLTPASGAGSDGTNYDATLFAFDNSGRRWRVEDPTGTVRRTVYDKIGRVSEQWIGTNDNDSTFPGGDVAGTLNMVKIEAMVYDSGNAKDNSHLTKRTAYVQDSTTDQRETNYAYDFRGRMLLQTNPTAPHTFNKYDDAGRLIASGQFSSTANINLATPDDPTTETSNRLALSQTFYDEKGQVWKSQRHKIDDADGSDDDTLQELTWYDATGRTIKIDGGQLTKSFYDRLGRSTHQFVIASIDDSGYGDTDDVSGDIILQESQTTYDADSGLVLMTAVIERHHDDYSTGETTGALDSNADADGLLYTAANIEGRIQITSNWYDSLDRLQDTVSYGNYGGSNFDRDALSVPARSDTALRTTYVYNADGTTKSVTDPKALETRFTYDDAGRQTVVINNYVDGTPSGTTGADDIHTRYSYTDGLKIKMHVDFDGDSVEDSGDQVTTWTYGVTKGGSAGDSKIGAGHLLKKVIYPAQSGGQSEADRRVSYAYNAQGQTIWTEDQTGNIIENVFDTSGRQTHRRVSTLGSGLDNAVLRISTTYDGLGRRSLVTQYDNATVGSGSVTDEVKFTYDDWGNIEKFEQDRNSAVGGGSDDYEISYTYAKSTSGRNTIQRSSMTLPSGNVIDFTYSSTGDLHDADASRVTEVKDGAVSLALYRYNGVGSIVGIDHDQPDIYLHRYSSTPGAYPDLDRFNRVTSDTWWKDIATDLAFFDTDIAYDRNSNITRTEDQIFSSGFDVSYTMDNLNRLSDADEGDWNGSSISSRTRQQLWTLDQVGNWTLNRWNRNGDADYIDSGEVDDSRTHNDPNEITDRDLDTDGDTAYDDTHYDLVYNKRGDMTDDGQHYEYVYDAFGRLRKINRTDNQNLVVEYHYNPLGFRRSWKYDTDVDGDVDGSDKTYNFAYDERWRMVANFRESDSSPKEEFVYHNAGSDGYGSSSYIDAVLLRDIDLSTNWVTGAADSMETREYYCQNWRADVVARISSAGTMNGWHKYSAYGVPYGIPTSDTDGDGTINTDDLNRLNGAWGTRYVTADYNLDGTINTDDLLFLYGQWSVTLGWGKLSQGGSAGGNRKGYAGYEFEPVSACALWHVRIRSLNSDLGRWARRDPSGYSDGPNMYAYSIGSPVGFADAMGLVRHVFAFEGLQASDVNSSWRPNQALPRDWEPIVRSIGAEWHYYTQEQVRMAVAQATAIAKAPVTDPTATNSCSFVFDTIVAAGYSMGGHAALQFAEILGDEYNIKVDLGFTADPVPNTELGLLVGFIFGDPGFTKPDNVTRWKNWFQRVDNSTIIPLTGIDGNPISGADNSELHKADFASPMNWKKAHTFMPGHPSVRNSLDGNLRSVPLTRLDWRWK